MDIKNLCKPALRLAPLDAKRLIADFPAISNISR
jgi:hypothetical protein